MQIRGALQGDFDEIAAISSSFCTGSRRPAALKFHPQHSGSFDTVSGMLDMLQDLIRHKWHANTAILQAVRHHRCRSPR